MNTSEVTTGVGFMVSLVGLLSTFFYVHLSNWFRDVLDLHAKHKRHAADSTRQAEELARTCRNEIEKIYNHVPFVVWICISLFLTYVTILAIQMTDEVKPYSRVFDYYGRAVWGFMGLYFILSLYFLIRGYLICRQIRKDDR